jgi:hypothetical protein
VVGQDCQFNDYRSVFICGPLHGARSKAQALRKAKGLLHPAIYDASVLSRTLACWDGGSAVAEHGSDLGAHLHAHHFRRRRLPQSQCDARRVLLLVQYLCSIAMVCVSCAISCAVSRGMDEGHGRGAWTRGRKLGGKVARVLK